MELILFALFLVAVIFITSRIAEYSSKRRAISIAREVGIEIRGDSIDEQYANMMHDLDHENWEWR